MFSPIDIPLEIILVILFIGMLGIFRWIWYEWQMTIFFDSHSDDDDIPYGVWDDPWTWNEEWTWSD